MVWLIFFRDKLAEIDDNIYTTSVTRDLDGTQTPSWPYAGNQPIAPGQPFITISQPGNATFTDIPIGSAVFINGIDTGCYVRNVDLSTGDVQLTDLCPIDISSLTSPKATFVTYEQDSIIGAYDNYTDNYLVSLQKRQELTTP